MSTPHSILATDCGSTTTKAILIMKKEDGYRLAGGAESPTTVEAPYENVMIGVRNAFREVQEIMGRPLLKGEDLIRPGGPDHGVDVYVSTSSAGGGLQMAVTGVVGSMTAESAARAALGAGAIVTGILAVDDGLEEHQRTGLLRALRPDMILMAGGTEGGNTQHVVGMAEIILAADPKPRFGQGFNLPVIFAGNQQASDEVVKLLRGKCDVKVVPNLRPLLEEEHLGPAREAIHEFFLEHVMAHAPGYEELKRTVDGSIQPTPAAVGSLMLKLWEREGQNVMAVDIGGATTDVFSVFSGKFTRTVSANLGLSYSAANVLQEAGVDRIRRWIPFPIERGELEDRIMNKMVRPTTIPECLADLFMEQALAREALRLSLAQHRELAVSLKGVQQQRSIADTFRQSRTGLSLVDMMQLDLLIASGGVLSHAPRRSQAVAMMMDSFQPEGVTRIAVDSVFMMPHLGVLSELEPDIALEVLKKDCLIPLGTIVAPRGVPKKGWALQVALDGKSPVEVEGGRIAVIPCPRGVTVQAEIIPRKPLDMGGGPGKTLHTTLEGGLVGIVVDARGRPLPLSPSVDPVLDWIKAMSLCEETCLHTLQASSSPRA